MELFERIEDLCRERGITIRQLEQLSGIGNGVISRWKTSSPTVSSLAKVTNYFGVSFDYIIGETDIRKINSLEQQEMPELEMMIKSLLIKLGSCRLSFNSEPINPAMVKIIQNMLSSNLEVWALINEEKKFN